MWHLFLLSGLIAALATSLVHGTALTYKLAGGEKACFFADVQPAQVDAKIAFYFAVYIVASYSTLLLSHPTCDAVRQL